MRIPARCFFRKNRVFAGIFAFNAVVFSAFLGARWVHDSYLIAHFGYGYMHPRLFNQGRVVSGLYLRLFDAVNMPYGAAMTLTTVLSLIFLSLAAQRVFKLAREHGANGAASGALAVLGASGLFFNLFTAETLLFFECAVMSLGALLAAYAAGNVLRGKRFRALALAVLCVFCYQAEIAYFLPLVLLYPSDTRRKLTSCAIYAVALVSNYAYVRVFSTDARVAGTVNIADNLSQCVTAARTILNNAINFVPRNAFLAFIIAFGALIIYECACARNWRTLLRAGLSAAALIVCAMLPHVAMSVFYVLPRSAVSLAGIAGLLTVALSICAKRARFLGIAIAVSFTLLVAFKQFDMQSECLRNNKLDAQEVSTIAAEIRRYEHESGVTVRTVSVSRDAKTRYHRNDVRNYEDLTVRMFSAPWMIAPQLSTALDREFADGTTTEADHTRLFGGRDWDEFTTEQLVFEGETLFLCIY